MPEITKARLFPSQRFIVAFMSFLGTALIYTSRVNLSVAVVCMVRDSASNLTTSFDSVNSTGDDQDMGGTCGRVATTGSLGEQSGEFDWDKGTVGRLLSMYFYGYILLQIPSGWLAARYGGKRVWGVGQAVCALCTLITPVCARTSVHLFFAVRFILGFAAGVTFPCMHTLLGRWSPPLERSKLASLALSGRNVGNIITFSASALLCEYGFDNGWGSIFYIGGVLNMLWVVAWFWLVSDSPDQHKHISETEKLYITTSIGRGRIKKVRRTPWRGLLASAPVWAIVIAHTCSNYLNYTLLTSLPTFMKESLNFDIKANGALSALTYTAQVLMAMTVGYVADAIRERRLMSTKNVRKLCQIISLLGSSAFVIIAGQMGCEERYVAVAMLCLSSFLFSTNVAAYLCNHLDLAPSYAGLTLGISNTFATLPGIIAPVAAAALTPNSTAEEWKSVFYVCAAVAIVGVFFYVLMADGELQTWAVMPEMNQQVKVDENGVKDTAGDVALLEVDKNHVEDKGNQSHISDEFI